MDNFSEQEKAELLRLINRDWVRSYNRISTLETNYNTQSSTRLKETELADLRQRRLILNSIRKKITGGYKST